MAEKKLAAGLKGSFTFTNEIERLASSMGSGEVAVLATPMLIAGMEAAAWHTVQAYLPEGMTTVGVHMDAWHTAPTPPGMQVTCEALLTSVSEDAKKLYFEISARDEADKIGHAVHERVVVAKDRFERNARQRGVADENAGKQGSGR